MPEVLTSKTVEGNLQKVYEIISDMTSYPQFMPNLVSVKLLSKEENKTTTHWVSNVAGRTIEWTEVDTFYPESYRIEYEQMEGDLKEFKGHWQLAQVPNGVSIELYVSFEFGIPMIAGMLNPLLKKTVRDNSENMLACIEKRISQK